MTAADLARALDRERARTARLRTMLTLRNRTIDNLLDQRETAPHPPLAVTPTTADPWEAALRELVDVLAEAMAETGADKRERSGEGVDCETKTAPSCANTTGPNRFTSTDETGRRWAMTHPTDTTPAAGA